MKTCMTTRSTALRQIRPAFSTLLAVACASAMALSGSLRAQTPGIDPTQLNSNRPSSAAQKDVAASAPLPSRAGKLVRSARARPPGESLKSFREANKFLEMLMRNENGQIPSNALVRAYEEKRRMTKQAGQTSYPLSKSPNVKPAIGGIQSNAWTWLGPDNVGGRTRSILIDPLDTRTAQLRPRQESQKYS